MRYDAHIPVEHVAKVDAAIASIRDAVGPPIASVKTELLNGISPEALFISGQASIHNDVHRALKMEEIEGCALLAQMIAHLVIRVAKLELANDARTANSENNS